METIHLKNEKDPFFALIFFLAGSAFSSDLISKETENTVVKIKTTVYSHKSFIDEVEGRYITDCSGFLAYVRAIPEALEEGEISPGHKRRRAVNFYDTVDR